MCEDCGCGDPELVPIDLHESLLTGNNQQARHNREHFSAHGTLALNVMGSPGAGKTALLEATARAMGDKSKILALSGDLATDHDAARLRAAGIESRAITTGTACHLDARLVHDALHALGWREADILFIENVGNLVCPAIYDLGQAANVVTLSVTEGEDKPLKYPVMFRKADLVVLTKTDLLPHLPHVQKQAIFDAIARTMPDPHVIEVSAVTGAGIAEWLAWLAAQRLRHGRVTDGHGAGQGHDHRAVDEHGHGPHGHGPHGHGPHGHEH